MKSDVEEEDLPTASVNDHCSIDYFETKFTEASTTTTIHIHDESTRIVKESLSQAGHDPRDQSKGEIAAYSTRHGARNQNRHKIICKWLLERFPRLPKNSMVLDVAGGKGELSSRLAMCHHLRVVMVDPRPADIVSVYTKTVVPKLPKKWQQQIHTQLQENPNFVEALVKERFQQFCMCFDGGAVANEPQLQVAIQSCSILIGIHADGATEAIVDAALQYGKPFVVIPCCVFPNLFKQRFILDEHDRKVEVRSHHQFCQFLLEKDGRFQKEILPFQGRNIAIWWDGE